MEWTLDMPNRPTQKIRNCAPERIPRIPHPHPARPLIRRIPHRRDIQERMRDSGFQCTGEEPRNEQLLVCRRESGRSHYCTPGYGRGGSVFCDGQFLDQDCGWVFPDKVAEIEHTGDPGISTS